MASGRFSRMWRVYGVVVLAAAGLAGCDGKAAVPQEMAAAVERGENYFHDYCAPCHRPEYGAFAPNLHGVLGRDAGSTDFSYSPAFKAQDFTWDEDSLRAFLQYPRQVVPDNRMAFFGFEDERMRADIVAFFKYKMK